MLSSILNLPRRRKSGPTVSSTPPPVTSQEPNREEDGFILLGESESERNTVMPSSARNGAIAVPPPPSYEQVTGTPPSLPPASVDSSYRGYTSPSTGTSPAIPMQTDNLQQTPNNRTSSYTANDGLNTSPGLNRSGNSNWGVVDVPFQLSAKLSQADGTLSDYNLPQLPEVDWRQYNYDFQFEENVKRESEMALERMEEVD